VPTLSVAEAGAILRKAGRQRGIEAEADRLATILRRDAWLRQSTRVEQAMGHRALALLRQLDAACAGEQDLARAAEEAFDQHSDAQILTTFPGICRLTGARILGEIGDDRTRFADARALKAYAGSAPITRASGMSLTVMTRRVKNQRLAAAGCVWAFSALAHDPGARAHYDRRRATGEGHPAAQRHLFNRMIGMLHRIRRWSVTSRAAARSAGGKPPVAAVVATQEALETLDRSMQQCLLPVLLILIEAIISAGGAGKVAGRTTLAHEEAHTRCVCIRRPAWT
jgi:hypothetical protein